MKPSLFSMARRSAAAATEVTAKLVQPPSPLARIGTIALILFIAYQVWDYVLPPKPPLSPALHDVSTRVIPSIVEDLRSENERPRSVVLLHLAGDNSDHLTNKLREALEANNIFDLHKKTLSERARDVLRMRHTSYGDYPAALKRGEELGADGVIFGTVRAFDSDEDGDARIDIEIQLANVQQQRIVFNRRYKEQLESSPLSNIGGAAGGLSKMGFVSRLLAWAVIVLLLPVFTITFVRAMVRRESNAANAFTLFIYTLVDALLAYLLLGLGFTSVIASFVFLVILGLVILYNMSVMTFALRLEA